jgi:molybdopterin-guanine dinucleotide biosynthesis protein MobB
MRHELPPVVSVIGKKNSGKTTLLVALAAELKRRGVRVASVKHSHHDFDFDHAGKDSWRHYHEGGVEAVLIASPHKVAVVLREDGADSDPLRLIREHLTGRGYDLVLVEAFKHIPFPRIEIFRAAAHADPIYHPAIGGGAPYLAIVTDQPERFDVTFPVITMGDDDSHVRAAADVVVGWLDGLSPAPGG